MPSRAARSTRRSNGSKQGLRPLADGRATDERGGKPRRYFTVTPAGLKALRSTHAAFASLARGLDTILEQP